MIGRQSPSMHVLGRRRGPDAGPVIRFGEYVARDGSAGAPVALDADRPHAGVVVGKRGSGKSYTLGVIAEELSRARGVAPIVLDPMGAFRGLSELSDGTVVAPRVRADALPPTAWPDLLGLDPEGSPGALVWQAAAEATSAGKGIDGMCAHVANADVPAATRRAAANHLDLAVSWGVFAPDGLDAAELASSGPTVVDLAGLPPAPANAVVRAVARGVYESRVDDSMLDRLPWLLVDEAHAFFDGIAAPALRTLLTRGRAPGVSLFVATQRPSALPGVALSQADLVAAHRLTSEVDRDALDATQSSYVDALLSSRLPQTTGETLLVDDVTESAHRIAVRERRTPHHGGSPRASDIRSGDGSTASDGPSPESEAEPSK